MNYYLMIIIICLLFFYIHTNPIKHGLTKDLYEWAYSSFQAYASLNPNYALEF